MAEYRQILDPSIKMRLTMSLEGDIFSSLPGIPSQITGHSFSYRHNMLAEDDRPYYFLSTVAKAMSVLEQFTRADGQLSVSEIARRTALPKSVVHRILATLTQLGFVA